MVDDFFLLALGALGIGALHTATGPDHYLPFIALARAGRWSMRRTLAVTLLCGLGHVLGSVLIGLVGVAAGVGISQLAPAEDLRGHVAAWLLIGFGLAYGSWGLVRAFKPGARAHHQTRPIASSTGAWTLFIIFVLGPCEPLIPLVMFPAAKGDYPAMIAVVVLFGLATLLTMSALVLGGVLGLGRLRLGALERYSHAMAGLIIFVSGGAIEFLGL
ncbi:MAG: hypothetical protein JXR83_07430 [Deltaproteobacteria bacterium]|nr:hypothetical protein [Deltaproteobacteria bacterium]